MTDTYGAKPVEGHESPLGGELHEKDFGEVVNVSEIWPRVSSEMGNIIKSKGDRVVGIMVVLAIGGTEDGSEQNHIVCDGAMPPYVAPYVVDAVVSQIRRAAQLMENSETVEAAERHLNRAERRRRDRNA